jgi:hypothetical protein
MPRHLVIAILISILLVGSFVVLSAGEETSHQNASEFIKDYDETAPRFGESPIGDECNSVFQWGQERDTCLCINSEIYPMGVAFSCDKWAVWEFYAVCDGCQSYDSLVVGHFGLDNSPFGNGPAMELWNWSTGNYDIIWDNIGKDEGFYRKKLTNPAIGVYIRAGDRLVRYRVRADFWDGSHVNYIQAWWCWQGPECNVNPTNLNFGQTCVGDYEDKDFTITNVGGGNLSGSVSESCNHYSIASGEGSYNLGAGQSRTVTVRFQPTSTGSKNCTVQTGSDCTNVSCSGTGEDCDPECQVVPTSLSFGTVCIGDYVDRNFTITNIGGGNLIGSVSESCNHYSIVSGGDSYNLSAGQSRTVTVRFQPTSTGTKNCTVETGSDCPNVSCSGTGQNCDPECQVDPTSLSFGTVVVGEYVDRSFTITNVGGGNLSGSVSESCNHYSIVSGGGTYNLSSGQSRTVTARFQPTSPGSWDCTVQTGSSCQNVGCSGTGLDGLKLELFDAIDSLEKYAIARHTLIAADFSQTMVYAYRSVHDLDAMWGAIGLLRKTYAATTFLLSISNIVHSGHSLIDLRNLHPLAKWICCIAINETVSWVAEQYWNLIWANTLERIDGFNYVDDDQLYSDIHHLVMDDPTSIQIQSRIELVQQKCENLRQYVETHDYNDATAFSVLIGNIKALAKDIKNSNEEGERTIVKWYCPVGHSNIDPPIPEKIFNIVNLGDWTTEHQKSSYYNTMHSMYVELTNDRRVNLVNYTATIAAASASLIIKTAVVAVLTVGTVAGVETGVALSALGMIIADVSAVYKEADASAAAAALLDVVEVAIPAAQRDLVLMGMMLDDVEIYVNRSMDPVYPPDEYPFGTAHIFDMDIPDVVYNSEDVPALIEGTVKLRNWGPMQGKANLYFDVEARSGPLRGQIVSIASIDEPIDVSPLGVVQIPFKIMVPQPSLIGGQGRFKLDPHATVGAGRLNFSSGIPLQDRCFDVIQTDRQMNRTREHVFHLAMQDSIEQGQSVCTTYTSSGYETEFWLDHTEGSLTLHLYDYMGNHTGYDYETQEIETEIPGSIYIGSSLSTGLIVIAGSMGQQYTLEVQAIEVDSLQAFSVTAVEIPEQPASLMARRIGPLVGGFPGDTISISSTIFETGGHNQVNGLTLSASDFVGSSGYISSSNVVFELSADTIAAGQNTIVHATIAIPIDVPIDDYNGSFSVNSLNAGSDEIPLTIHLGNPPDIPTIPCGPTVGLAYETLEYTTISVDTDDDSVYYLFDWGDSSHQIWSGPMQSGQPCTTSHIWGQEGTYYVKVKAMDIWNLQSYWSDSLTVTIEMEGPEGLLAYWSSDEGTDTVLHDNSGRGHDGIIYGATWVDGISGSALSFDGVDDYVEIPDVSDFVFVNQSLTYSAWVQIVDNANSYREFICLAEAGGDKRPGIHLVKSRSGSNEGRVSMQVDNGTQYNSAVSIQDGDQLPKSQWMHLVGVVDYQNSLIKLYINGIFQDEDYLPNYDLSEAQPLGLRLGWSTWGDIGFNYHHKGLMDEVRIYDRALSEDEVEWLYCDPFRGDANGDSEVGPGDVVFLINYLYRSGDAPDPMCAGDANGDGVVGPGDIVYLINYLFRGGSPPVLLAPNR